MRRWMVTIGILTGLGIGAGGSVVGLGLYNVSATGGHWPGVSWLLHTVYKQSVRLRTPDDQPRPDLGDPGLIALGAGHYISACAPCHSAPDLGRTATMAAMVPPPPEIGEALEDWQPGNLHWIVANGIKMTGMPGWPAPERSDEVWSVVAYLEAVRRGTAPDADAPPYEARPSLAQTRAYCANCHDGTGAVGPRLDIQSADYLLAALQDYRGGRRRSGLMEHAVSVVPEAEMDELAEWFAAGPDTARPGDAVPAAEIAEDHPGAALARTGTRDVPRCTACHDRAKADARYPALAGQGRGFLETQLRLWRSGTRAGSHEMLLAAQALTDSQISDLADWYASLPPGWRQGATRTDGSAEEYKPE
ncbi:MAG: c-type cytochrome [Rhodobacteraceae bacterium]|nr:c-type cytochrome [Paracoccaceae bacterium]